MFGPTGEREAEGWFRSSRSAFNDIAEPRPDRVHKSIALPSVDQLSIAIPVGTPEEALKGRSYSDRAKQTHGLAGRGGVVDDDAGMVTNERRGRKKRKR